MKEPRILKRLSPRHARACPAHPRFTLRFERKTWMAGRAAGHDPERSRPLRRLVLVATIALAAVLCAATSGPASADDPVDLQFVPKVDRFALMEAYRRGGEVERAALEAEVAPIPGAD